MGYQGCRGWECPIHGNLRATGGLYRPWSEGHGGECPYRQCLGTMGKGGVHIDGGDLRATRWFRQMGVQGPWGGLHIDCILRAVGGSV